METLAVIAGIGVAIALAGLARLVHRASVQAAREAQRVATLLEDIRGDFKAHEDKCRDRWERNWTQHDDFRDRLSRLEGRTE